MRNSRPAGAAGALAPSLLLALVTLLLPLAAPADFHVVAPLRVEPTPEWGRQATNLTISRDWWFGRNVMAFTHPGLALCLR